MSTTKTFDDMSERDIIIFLLNCLWHSDFKCENENDILIIEEIDQNYNKMIDHYLEL